MKRLLSPFASQSFLDLGLLVLRVAVGSFMLVHGLPKLESLTGPGPVQFADPIGLGTGPSLALAVFAEVGCSILLILGLATRLATIPLLVTMTVAAAIVHRADDFGTKEKALLYLVIYLLLLIAGAGRISLDYLLTRRGGRKR